jgi:putative membrane protein
MRYTALLGSIGALCATIAVSASAQGIPAPAQITVDDSYILGVRANVDQSEIETARWAMTHGSTKAVRDFAQSLLRGHSAAQNQAEDLAKRLNIDLKIPADTDRAIRDRDSAQRLALHALSGAKYDHAFLFAIWDEHNAEIDKVNGWYASAATSDSVKAYLHAIMPTLVKHQQTAEKLMGGPPKVVAAH